MTRVNCHRCPRPTNRPLTRRPTKLRYLCHRTQLQRRLRLPPPMRFPQKTRRRPNQALTHLTPLSPPMHSRRSPVVDSPEVHSNNRGSRMWLRPSTLFSTQPPSVHLFHHNVDEEQCATARALTSTRGSRARERRIGGSDSPRAAPRRLPSWRIDVLAASHNEESGARPTAAQRTKLNRAFGATSPALQKSRMLGDAGMLSAHLN
jgi:hypothetical protein